MTACLPDCIKTDGHAHDCPNAPKPAPEPQGVDFEAAGAHAAQMQNRSTWSGDENLARAYLALRAEVERLKSERVNKRSNPSEPTPFEHCLAENERLKAEVEELKRRDREGLFPRRSHD